MSKSRRRKQRPTKQTPSAKKPAAARSSAAAGKQHAAAARPAVGRTGPAWPVVALASAGMLITLYLTGVAWSGDTPAFCTPGSGCDVIQQSRWSVVLGLPVALWGFGVYALLALFAWRMRPGLKRWRRLWNLSLIGLGISLYLTVVGIVSLDAVCGWCLASLATMGGIFGVVAWRRPASAPGMPWPHWGLNSAVIGVLALGLLHAYYSGWFDRREDPRLQALATHLSETDARYYGAFWCGSCQEQNRLFGPSAERLPYTECTPSGRGGPISFACQEAGVTSFPTWHIGGQRMEGVLTPQELARLSGFDWER